MKTNGEAAPIQPAPKRRLARRVLRWILWSCLLLLLILVPLLVIRTVGQQSMQPLVQKATIELPDSAAMARTLAAAIQFETVSDDEGGAQGEAFLELHEHLQASFPRVHATLQRELVAKYSLLYTWKGSNPKLPGLLLAAHMDVVPATPADWSHDPWSGDIADGYIYGRGSLDDKVNVLGILEAAEQLLREGYAPQRTIYFAFGHDEEIGGYQGASAIAALLKSRGTLLEAVVDEGLVITKGVLPGLKDPLAVVGVAEKGFVNVELKVGGQGGHSSMPPKESAIGVLSQAVVHLEADRMPGRVAGAVEEMFRFVGPELPFTRRVVMANLWLFRGLVRSSLTKSDTTDALLRTTTAATILEAGVKSNVLAQRARAVVNFRILPGDSVAKVLAHVRRVVNNKKVTITALESVEPQSSSRTDSRVFSILQRSIRSIDPTIVVAPGLMLAMTDSRHYRELTTDIYRFSALRFAPDDLKRLHGIDERVSIENYAELVAFQLLLLREGAQ